MSRVNRPMREALKEAAGVSTDRSVQLWIKDFCRKHLVSPEQAERMIAYEKGVDIQQFLTEEELAETRELLTREGLPVVQVVRPSRPPQRKVLKVGWKELDDPLLPPSVAEDARRMAEVYLYLYMFENSVRNFIQMVMEKEHGKDWWDDHVSQRIRTKVAGRMENDRRNAWHGKRGAHEIFYTDIGDIKSIIARNHTDFDPLFNGLPGGRGWLEQRIAEIELSRNIVDHHNPLADRDVKRIKMYLEDWQKHLDAIKDQL